jgi:hypothetical protein
MTTEGSRIAKKAIKTMEEMHQKIVGELNKFGEELGFNIDCKKLLFGIPDVVWSLNLKELCDANGKKIFNLNKDFIIPVAIFEVIYSEGGKKIRGSFTNLHLNRSLFKAVVILPKRYYKYDKDEWWKRDIERIINLISPFFPDVNVISDTRMGVNFISYKRFLNRKSLFKGWLKYFIFG